MPPPTRARASRALATYDILRRCQDGNLRNLSKRDTGEGPMMSKLASGVGLLRRATPGQFSQALKPRGDLASGLPQAQGRGTGSHGISLADPPGSPPLFETGVSEEDI